MKLKHSLFVLVLFFSSNAFAIDVLIAKKSIAFKEKISSKQLMLFKASKVARLCKPFTLKMLNSDTYVAKHFINKESIICTKDIKKYKNESVIFNFGSLEIEKNGKIIFQNDKYITIKKSNGKIEKIYKDGKIR